MDLDFFQYIDRHMAINIIKYYAESKIYSEENINTALLQLLSETHGIDDEIEYFQKVELTETVPRELQEKREKIKTFLLAGEKTSGPLFIALTKNKSEIMSNTVSNMIFNRLQAEFETDFSNLLCYSFQFVQFKFDIGKYEEAYRQLELIHPLMCFVDMKRYVKGCWGKLCCAILLGNYSRAETHISELIEVLSQMKATPAQTFTDQLWLFNWALFVYFHTVESLPCLIELYYDSSFFNAIITRSPYLMRYLAVAVIISQNEEKLEHINVLARQIEDGKDYVVSFVKKICSDFDLSTMAAELKICRENLKLDYFANKFADDFYRFSCNYILKRMLKIFSSLSIKKFTNLFEIKEFELDAMIQYIHFRDNFPIRVDYKKDSLSSPIIPESISLTLYNKVDSLVNKIEKLVVE